MIITICGSGRFYGWLNTWHRALTLSGHLVFDQGMPPSNDAKTWMTSEDSERVAKAMRDKIMLSSALVCLNPFAYMGEDTLAIRAFAEKHHKPVYTLESWGNGEGVGPHHDQAWRYAKTEVFGLPMDYVSPVDTAKDWHDPYDLLPPAGELRQRLVKMVKASKDAIVSSVELLQAQGVVQRDY